MGPDLSVLKFRVFWEADYSSAFHSQICNTAYSLRRLRWVTAYKYFTDTWVSCAQGAVNEKTLLTYWNYLWSQSTYEPSSTYNHHHPDWEASTYCFIPDPSHQVWRYTRHEAFPTPHRFLHIFHFYALNIPLKKKLEQLLTHRSHTATWHHPSQVFLPESEAKENPQRKPSGSFCVETCPRHLGICVFYRQPQSTQVVFLGAISHLRHKHRMTPT